jgi:multicomponent Na+:H+ antiporter subunit F
MKSRAGSNAVFSRCWADSMPVVIASLAVALTMLAVAAGLTFIRLLKGPTLPDRVIASDLVGVLMVCILVVTAAATAEQAFFDVAMVVALISFVGTVAYSRYIERSRS